MLMGHYAAALAAKAAVPRAPLWSYVLAAQLVDILWTLLIVVGLEQARIDTTLPGAPLHLDHMPWSHSLPAALFWSLLAFGVSYKLLRLPRTAAFAVAAVVLSHWVLDLLVHRPDLALGVGNIKLGFSMWNVPVTETTFEIGLLGLAALLWAGQQGRSGLLLWPAATFFVVLVFLQIVSQIMPTPETTTELAFSTLSLYVSMTVLAFFLERRNARPKNEV